MINALYSRRSLAKQPVQFRIEAVVSDGMWYSLSKWQKIAQVSEKDLLDYVEKAMADGTIVQSPVGTRSYRMPVESIKKWYDEQGLDIDNTQLLDFAFPPRIWNGRTEPEGFLEAPVREIGVVSFIVDKHTASEVANNLRGIAKVREVEPGKYKAYGLNSSYIKERVVETIENNCGGNVGNTKVYSRQISKRREMSDFDPKFAQELINFYKEFGKTLVKQSAKTIKIFIPSPEEQDAQVLMWILEAIEKFDESASVPFPGYLDTVLRRWPYNLPNQFLGKELSQFQKNRAKAIEVLKDRHGDNIFSYEDIAKEMDMDYTYFTDLEEKHKAWIGTKNAESFMWEDRGEERTNSNTMSVMNGAQSGSSNMVFAHNISVASIQSALESGHFDDCASVSRQVDSGDINPSIISTLSQDFTHFLSQNIRPVAHSKEKIIKQKPL